MVIVVFFREHSADHPVKRLFILLLAVLLGGVSAVVLAVAPAGAQERVEVRCTEAEWFTTGCTEDLLQSLINDAGTTPTRILLGHGDGSTEIMLSRTLNIPAGADIEFVNLPDLAWGGHEATLFRVHGYTGTLLRVQDGATLTLSQQQRGKVVINSNGGHTPAGSPTVLVNGEADHECG